MLSIVVTSGRDSDIEQCDGRWSVALTPYLYERFDYVTPSNSFADLVAVPKFGLRRPTGLPFRVASRDGFDGRVVEMRLRPLNFFLFSRLKSLALKVDLFKNRKRTEGVRFA